MVKFSSEIELRGHLIDSLILTKVFDGIMDHGGSFEVLEIKVGKKKKDESYAKLLVIGKNAKNLETILNYVYRQGATSISQNNVKLVVSHQRRFTPGWTKAKEVIESGAIGEPIRAELRVKDGLLNWGTHSIDGARYILGDPKAKWVVGAVERYTNKFERDTPIEDSCIGLIHFEKNIQFFIQSDLMDNECDAGKFEIYGTNGFLKVTETDLKIFNEDSKGWKNIDLNLKEGDKAIGGNMNAEQTKELIKWIEGGKKHRGAGDIAAETVEIMMGIYESARLNRVINFPMKEKDYPLSLMIAEGKLPLEIKERYDIRGFLNRENIDEELYAKLRDDGLHHHQAMQIVNRNE